jgi:PilZ domain
MASARAMIERRRSSRILIRIPVQVFSDGSFGQPLDTPAEAIAVSRFGALLRAPFSPALGSRIEVLNRVSQETQEFRVVRVQGADDGNFELGIEILYPTKNFWHVHLPDESFA